MVTGPISDFLKGLNNQANSPYYLPTTTDTSNLVQSSASDISATINGVMQSMLGRFATDKEIQEYGAQLLAAERANPGSFAGKTTYAISGKRNEVTGTQLSSGVNPASFIENLLRGKGEARDYQAATKYFDAMQQSNNKFRSAFSG